MTKTVHKAICAKTCDDFNKQVNNEVRTGWTKSEATVFSSDGIYACLSAPVDQILLPFPKQTETELRADEIYKERFKDLATQFQTRQTDVPKALPSGSLCAILRTVKEGRFEYNGMTFDLALVHQSAKEKPVLAVIRRDDREQALFSEFSAYQS